ncbi:MAG: ABATE domain-containing protein, partial [Gaiellaceae bacterium]
MEPVEHIHYLEDRDPAPGRLALVQRFANTVDPEHGREMLSSPARLVAVLSQLGLLVSDTPASRAELEQALELRAALRELALAN